MIIGTGSDLIDIRRIEKTLERFGERFILRYFTETEIQKAERRRPGGTHIATYAKRFAAKEACSKALGTGFNQGVYMKDIGVVNTPAGKPTLALTGGAKKRLEAMVPKGMKPVIHVTITDEAPMAHVLVIIEAIDA
ncbi:MAG: holo-ACP synthase [Alphaproteobacteria bacterium PRO2]|nr:holo-ACP synthase [Alphaproteobacteria bacterium PRO2]